MSSSAKLLRALAAALVIGVGVAACGGGGGGGSDDDSPVNTKLSCKEQFNPDKAAAGDDCVPTYNAFCPAPETGVITNDTTITACTGVTVSSGTVSYIDGDTTVTSDYTVLTPSSGGHKGLIVALHWSNGTGVSMVDHMRMSELAQGRDVTVVLPTAPGSFPFRTWGTSVIIPTTTLAQRTGILDALIAQVQGNTAKAAKANAISANVFVVGVSGGAVMAFEYACQRSDAISGAMFVAAEITPGDLSGCTPTAPVATVQVHGTGDIVGWYAPVPLLSAGVEETFANLYTHNGCVAADVKSAEMAPGANDLPAVTGIKVEWATPCSSGKGNALVTVEGGGHNWPGFVSGTDLGVNLFGVYSDGFDATLQGYDLLRFVAN
ncbi:MAG: alpha/beta hydrolase family esterase [Solimonas sp.]